MTTRRGFLRGASCALAIPLFVGSSACERKLTKPEVIERMVSSVLVPDVRALPLVSLELERSIKGLSDAKDAKWQSACQTFKATLLAWQRVQVFRLGPVVESNALLRSTFWPPRPAKLANLLASETRLNDALVLGLGVDAKGLFALELLLFNVQSAGLPQLFGPESARTRALAALLASDVRRYAESANAELGDGRALAKTLTQDPQASIQRIVNIMVETTETAVADRLQRVLGLSEQGRLTPEVVQAAPSGLSAKILLVWFETMQRMYVGAQGNDGLSALVKQVAAPADERLRKEFSALIEALKALDGSLEGNLPGRRKDVESVLAHAKRLEVTLKTELASALGVTLSIIGGDGD